MHRNANQLERYQRYIATKRLPLPRDKPSRVYPKLCQSTMNAECLIQLAHFTATKVGTDGGFFVKQKQIDKGTIE